MASMGSSLIPVKIEKMPILKTCVIFLIAIPIVAICCYRYSARPC